MIYAGIFLFMFFGQFTIGMIQHFYMKESRIQVIEVDFIFMTLFEGMVTLGMFIKSRFWIYTSRRLKKNLVKD